MRQKFNSLSTIILVLAMFTYGFTLAKKDKDKEDEGKLKSSTFTGLKLRSIGPAFASGRIADFSVNPENNSEWLVAVACGHIWKTENNGTTFNPVFDNYGSYSIGCLVRDPNNPNVIWAGTGENNHQRALGYGNGVYKSTNGGSSWKNMGLKESRQVGKIVIDPRNSDIVFVAAEGSAWGPGGDRGLYKTKDGGKTWKKVLEISDETGVNNVVIDPENPDLIYATSEQRRRHVYTKIGGGPESRFYKSTDNGETWEKITKGLPSGHVGGMGLAISPVNTDVLYIIAEAEGDKGGFFRSVNRGESWKKMSDHHSSGQYYNEIYCDPVDVDKVYSMETIARVTTDGGKTWSSIGNNNRHVDDHAMWIDPEDTRHFLIGGDGGVYESFDGGKNYVHKSNLPVTQFYRVTVDNDKPFYNIYGGTQDNNSFGGPVNNLSSAGVTAGEWIITIGGDGFWQAVDPTDPNIVYSEWQYGNSVRYDKKSGESISIKPQPRKGEKTYRWNWNAPLILSPHSHKRLYAAANKVFRSDDRGDSWQVISDDLTRNMDRNKWKVMGKFWSVDAVAKDVSTSQYGTIVSFAESVVREDLLYAGTDDGLIQVTQDAGNNWKKTDKFEGVPEYTYVSDICPSKFDENVVFAAFDNRKRDDFKPYILKSTDKGQSWESISSNLPDNGTVHTIEQDHKNPELLFAGTEFGLFFTINGGKEWVQLTSGIPDVAVRDIDIQERENDLALATFGRGFYILDDYTPLRSFKPEILEKEAHMFPVKDAKLYIRKGGRYGQGSTPYLGKNSPYGATFTYYLKEGLKTEKDKRKEKEKEQFKEGEKIEVLSWDELREEGKEEKPHIRFTIFDDQDNIIRKFTTKASKGIHRITWDFRYESSSPVRLRGDEFDPMADGGNGILAIPGTYRVSISKVVKGKITELVSPTEFNLVALNNTTIPAENREDVFKFQEKTAELSRTFMGAMRYSSDLAEKTEYILQTLYRMPKSTTDMINEAKRIQEVIDDIEFKFYGHSPKASWEEVPPDQMPLRRRFRSVAYTHYSSTAPVTQTEKDSYNILKEELTPILEKLRKIGEQDIKVLEEKMDKAGAPWTPGRVPDWN